MTKYLQNIEQNPTDEKFKKIKKGNKAFTNRVLALKGSEDFLAAIGWIETEVDGEAFFIHMGTLDQIKQALAALAEPSEVPKPTLYRNPKHLSKTQGTFVLKQKAQTKKK